MSQTRSIMEEYDKCPLCGKYYDVELGCECQSYKEEEENE